MSTPHNSGNDAAATASGIDPFKPWLASASAAWEVMSASHADAASLAALQAQRLRHLLLAARRTRAYERLLHGRDIERMPLSALPVIHKHQLMQEWSDHVVDPLLTLDRVRRFCADAQRVAQPLLGRYWVWESSGSTGEPTLFVQDGRALAVYDALEAWRRAPTRPWARLFDPMSLGERFAFVGAIDGHFASHVSVRRLQAANPWLAPPLRCFSILQPTAALVQALDSFAPSSIATYPTAAVMLADQARAGRLRSRPAEVWTGGETLSAAMRQHIEQAFGCQLRNSYGASEFLPIAWECAQQQLHVNADWVILEAVDARHRPVAAGVASSTTLLTNLANHVQPLIRLDIGDRIRWDTQPCRCGSALPTLQVQGRQDNALIEYSARGVPVTLLPLALTTLLEEQAGVFDFLLRQQCGARWDLTLGPGAPHTRAVRERCTRVLIDFARLQGVDKLRIVTHTSTARALGRSGKSKRIVACASAPDCRTTK